jgi:hypothetical protein
MKRGGTVGAARFDYPIRSVTIRRNSLPERVGERGISRSPGFLPNGRLNFGRLAASIWVFI